MNHDEIRKRGAMWDVLTKIFLLTWMPALGFQVWVVQSINDHEKQLLAQRIEFEAAVEKSNVIHDSLAANLRTEFERSTTAAMVTIAAKLELIQISVIRLEEANKSAKPTASK